MRLTRKSINNIVNAENEINDENPMFNQNTDQKENREEMKNEIYNLKSNIDLITLKYIIRYTSPKYC